jgi:D-aminopeptidase
MFMAEDMKGIKGRTVKAIPIKETIKILKKYNALDYDKLPKAVQK